jgi:hypothetical protein
MKAMLMVADEKGLAVRPKTPFRFCLSRRASGDPQSVETREFAAHVAKRKGSACVQTPMLELVLSKAE